MNYLTITAKKKWITSSVLILVSLMPAVAWADDPDQAPSSGRSSGGRGCGTSLPASEPKVPSLILLDPAGTSPQTSSTRPQFAWFVRDAASISMEFRLYAQLANNRYTLIKEIKDNQFKTTPGINLLTLAPTTPELAIGRYRWQVVLVCDRNRPSSNLFATSELEVIPSSIGLNPQFQPTPDRDIKDDLIANMTLNSTERQLLQKSAIHPIER